MRNLFRFTFILLNIVSSLANNYTTPPNSYPYKLGPNLVANPNISTPVIAPSEFA